MILLPGDCLEMLQWVKPGSVDMVLADPPYGVTANKWDRIIPPNMMWEEIKRVIKPLAPVVLFGQQPFSSILIMSNHEMFKYQWVWVKNRPSGVAQAKNKPLSTHEDVLIFSSGVCIHKGQSERRMNYFPQGLERINKICRNKKNDTKSGGVGSRPSHKAEYVQEFTNYPRSVLYFDAERGKHSTQKPVPLLEYLIKTYTTKGDTVLDFTMGSGSTGIACRNTGREFIGIEKDPEIFRQAVSRLKA